MRRTLEAGLVAICLALTVMPAATSVAGEGGSRGLTDQARAAAASPQTARERATAALARAESLFSTGTRAADRRGRAPLAKQDGSLVMRDLFASLGDLSPTQRAVAHGLLARPTLSRPTQGPKDPLNYGYTVPAKRKCKGHFCLHWVTSTADAAPSNAWVNRMLKLMNHVWKREINQLGYRQPPNDRGRGGNDKFDVYLKELASQGLYGFCAPERRKPGFQWLASGYCVLDNDFVGFPRPPLQSAEVTAAHEFFHAIQFGYDYGEDAWLLEATATWMEEQVYDDVNDNRQYLPDGQVAQPLVPLDYFGQSSNQQYGNWTFFEYLSHKYGTGIVKQIWNNAAAFTGAPDMYSTRAITSVLKPRGGFKKVYAQDVSANLLPAKFFSEGKNWSVLDSLPSPLAGTVTLSRSSRRTGKLDKGLLHMSSASWEVKSSSSLHSKKWYLKIKVDGPKSFRMPAAFVLVAKRKGFEKRLVKLNGKGNGKVVVPFSRKKVKAVYVSLVNASTRFNCGKGTQYTCSGRPIDDRSDARGQRYAFSATVIKR